MPTLSPPFPSTPPQGIVEDDGDFEYFYSLGGVDIPIPRWLAEIVDVPTIVRVEIFLIGVCTGLILAALALFVSFLIALG